MKYESVEQNWRFDGDKVTLTDAGRDSGSQTITRTLIASLPVKVVDGAVVLRDRYRIEYADAEMTVRPIPRCFVYGYGVPAIAITITRRAALPFAGEIGLTVIS